MASCETGLEKHPMSRKELYSRCSPSRPFANPEAAYGNEAAGEPAGGHVFLGISESLHWTECKERKRAAFLFQ